MGDGTGRLEIHITRGQAGAVGTDRRRMQRDLGEESVQNLPRDRMWGWRREDGTELSGHSAAWTRRGQEASRGCCPQRKPVRLVSG